MVASLLPDYASKMAQVMMPISNLLTNKCIFFANVHDFKTRRFYFYYYLLLSGISVCLRIIYLLASLYKYRLRFAIHQLIYYCYTILDLNIIIEFAINHINVIIIHFWENYSKLLCLFDSSS